MQIDEKEGSASLLSKIYGQNQNANFTQSVESAGKVKTTNACFSVNKCSKVEMKTLNAAKAGKMLLFTAVYHKRIFMSDTLLTKLLGDTNMSHAMVASFGVVLGRE